MAAISQTSCAVPNQSSLQVSFAWAFAGNLFYSASQWVTVVILAKLGNPTIVGQFALGLAITSPILMFTNLQLRTVQATDVGARFAFGDYVALRLLGIGGFVLAVAAVGGRYRGATLAALCAVAAMKVSESLSDAGYGMLHARERLDRIAQSQMLKAMASTCGLWVIIVWTGSCLAGMVAIALAYWITLVTFDRSIITHAAGAGGRLRLWNWPQMRELFRVSLPLGLTLLLVSLNANLPRYFLEHYRGIGQVGIFSALAYVTLSANLFVMALGQAMTPRMAKARATGAPAFTRLSATLFLVAGVVGVVGMVVSVVAGRALLHLLYGPEYAKEHHVFIWLMFSGTMAYLASAAGFSLSSARFFRAQLPLLLLVCGVTAAACAGLVPKLGATGAAMAQAGGYAVQLACSLAYLIFAMRRDPLA